MDLSEAQELLGSGQRLERNSLEVTIKENRITHQEIDEMKDKLFAAIKADETFTIDGIESEFVLKYFKVSGK